MRRRNRIKRFRRGLRGNGRGLSFIEQDYEVYENEEED